MLFHSRAQEAIDRYAHWLSADVDDPSDESAPWVDRQLTLLRKKQETTPRRDNEPSPPTRKDALATVRNTSAALTGDTGMGLSRLLREASRRDLDDLRQSSQLGSPPPCALPLLLRGRHFSGPTLPEGSEPAWIASFLPGRNIPPSAATGAIALTAYHLHALLADWSPRERDWLVRRFLADHLLRNRPLRLRIDDAEALPKPILSRLLPLVAHPHSVVFAGAEGDWMDTLPDPHLLPRFRLDALSPYAIQRFALKACGGDRARALLHWMQDHGEAAQLAAHPRYLAMLAAASAAEAFAPGTTLPEVLDRELTRRLQAFPSSMIPALRAFLSELSWTKPEALTLAFFETRATDFLKKPGLGELRAILGPHEQAYHLREKMVSKTGLMTQRDARLGFTEGWGDFLRATHLAGMIAHAAKPEDVMLPDDRGSLGSSLEGMIDQIAWHPTLCLLAVRLEEEVLRWLLRHIESRAPTPEHATCALLQHRLALILAQRFHQSDGLRLRVRWWELGAQLKSMDQWAEALAYLRVACANAAKHPLPHQQEEELMETRLLAEVGNGHFSKARRILHPIQKEFEVRPERVWAIEVHRLIGSILVQLEVPAEAVPVLQWAGPKAIQSPQFGEFHLCTLDIHRWLGTALCALNRKAEAVPVLQWAAPRAKDPQRGLGEFHPCTLDIHRALGAVLCNLDREAEAVPVLQWTAARAKDPQRGLGEFDLCTLDVHQILGAALCRLNRAAEAIPVLQWAAQRARDPKKGLGEFHPCTLAIHFWLGDALSKLNRHAEAVPVLQWAAQRASDPQRGPGEFDRRTLDIHQALGGVLGVLNRAAEAVPILQWAAQRASDPQRGLGEFDFCTLDIHRILGVILCQLDRHAEALPVLQWAAPRVKDPQRGLGEFHPCTLDIHRALGAVLCNLDREAEAVPVLQWTAARAKDPQRGLGEFHPCTLDIHLIFGAALCGLNRAAEAIRVLQWAAQRARDPKKGRGEFDPCTLGIHGILGTALFKLGRNAEGITITEWTITRACKVFGKNDPSVRSLRESLAQARKYQTGDEVSKQAPPAHYPSSSSDSTVGLPPFLQNLKRRKRRKPPTE